MKSEQTTYFSTASILLMILLLAGFSGCSSSSPSYTEFWVSPQGNDGAAGTATAPFATLERARDAIRSLPQPQRNGDIAVTLRGGTYRLDHKLMLDGQDSGQPGHPVVYRAAPGEYPVITGSMQVKNWSPDNSLPGVYRASVGKVTSRQLYINGVRATRARTIDYPPSYRPGFYYLNGVPHPDGIQYLPPTSGPLKPWQDPAQWTNIPKIEAVIITQWKMMTVPLESRITYPGYTPYPKFLPYVPPVGFPPLTVPARTGLLVMKEQPWKNANLFLASTTNQPGLWSFWQVTRFENAKQFLDEPGEWYLDESDPSGGMLYYMPRPGEDMATAQVELPLLDTLIEAQGQPAQPVANIRFEGLTFAYATWTDPAVNGYVSDQSGFHLVGDRYPVNVYGHVQEPVRTPGNVRFVYARNIAFKESVFMHLGAVGLDFDTGSQGNSIENCLFTDISSAAIQLGGITAIDHHPTSPEQVTQDNRITNNVIYKAGQEYVDVAGIYVGFSRNTLISNNTISDVPWSGIAMGWGWGLLDAGMFPGVPGAVRGQWGPFTTPTINSGNRITNNLIQRFLQVVWDGGAIYTTGQQGSSMEDALLIEGNVARSKRAAAGGNTFYTDGGSRYIVLKGNVSYDNPTGHVDLGPAATADNLLPYPPYSALDIIPYGFDLGGCQTYGDITFIGNYLTNLLYFNICPYWENGLYYPTNLNFLSNFLIQGVQNVPQSILSAAGAQNFPQRLLDAAGVTLP